MSIPTSQLPSLASLGAALRTQDNRCTADPIYLVEKRERFYGVDLDYADRIAWMTVGDGDEVTDPKEVELLEAADEQGFPLRDHYKVGYLDRWVYVMPFLTEAGANAYVTANRHRHDDLRVYVDSAYRNPEWQAVRAALMALPEPQLS